MYKTGDSVRYLADGNLEFVGRIDNQVKVRGFRIELSEIENILWRHTGIRQTAVLAREDDPGNKRLVAYIAPQSKLDLTTDRLRSYLKERLPEFMIPSVFVLLDDLPLTANGKLDRKALPIPDHNRLAKVEGYQSPRTTMEEALANIWAEALGAEKVGIQDNFFELGGHSLLAVRLVDMIKRRIGQTVSVASIFQAPTVERMATVLHDHEATTPCSLLVPLQTNGSHPAFFWVHGDGSNPYLSRYLEPEQRLYGLQHQSTDGQPAHYRTVKEIASHYLSEIFTVQRHGPYRLGGNCFGAIVAFEMAHQLQNKGERVQLLALLNPATPIIGTAENASRVFQIMLKDLRRLPQSISSGRFNMRWNEALKKLNVRMRDRVLNRVEFVKRATQKAPCSIYDRCGVAIPVSLRSRDILEIYFHALRFYRPRPFEGNMVLFLGTDYSLERWLHWSNQCTGIVTIHHLPGDHGGDLEERNGKVWARQLAAYLDALEGEPPAVKAVKPAARAPAY